MVIKTLALCSWSRRFLVDTGRLTGTSENVKLFSTTQFLTIWKKKILQWTFDFSGLFLKFFPVLKSCKSDLSHVHTEQYTYTVQTHNVPNGSKNNKPDFQKKNPISGLFLAYSRYFPLFFFGLYLHDAHRFLYYLHAASHSKISEYLLKFMLNDKIVKRCKTLETENR